MSILLQIIVKLLPSISIRMNHYFEIISSIFIFFALLSWINRQISFEVFVNVFKWIFILD